MPVAVPLEPTQTIGAAMRRRLAGFVRTLRHNGFAAGLAETRDGLAILASPMAMQPRLLKPAFRALFCATHSDWERFDEIFDAYWLGRGRRHTWIVSGTPTESQASLKRLADTELESLAALEPYLARI